MKAVIYARYSSERQTEQSIEGQLRECNEYAAREKITIVNNYIDRAISGKTDNRPAFQKMIADSASNEFDCVLVYKLDRFARNRYDNAMYKAKLKKNGVRFISAKENITDSPEGIILEGLLEAMNGDASSLAEDSVQLIHSHHPLRLIRQSAPSGILRSRDSNKDSPRSPRCRLRRMRHPSHIRIGKELYLNILFFIVVNRNICKPLSDANLRKLILEAETIHRQGEDCCLFFMGNESVKHGISSKYIDFTRTHIQLVAKEIL